MVASVGQPRTLPASLDRPLSPPLSTTHQLFPSPSTSSSNEDGENEQKFNNGLLQLLPIPEPSIHDPLDTADGWIERHSSLIRLTGKQPFNSEPPLSLLMSHGFITPVPIHYVRNHGAVPGRFADWFTWTVEICGLVNQPGCFTVAELVREFPSFEIPVTLVCAGNRRKEQNMVQQTIGFNWGPAAIATSVWRGVRLRDVLRRCGVMGRRGGALNVCFEGAEDLPGGGGGGVKYGTSLKMEVAMDPSRDIMIAYMQNGEVLTPDHGFPCRMIIPGFIGGRMVKWLKRIMVTTRESDNYYHYKDNRVLPSHVDAELADTEGWWYKPEHLINELNINSVITTPAHNETVQINSATTPATYALRGYAYTGGGKKVTRVEISLDSGDTWRVCAINHHEKPNKYGKYWCWCFWSLHLDPLHLLAAEDISVRAWDETHNTQPRDLIWNLMGMMNNCWFRVRITARKSLSGDATLTFEHPTQPGNLAGGWMPRRRQQISSGEIKKNVSTPFINNMPTSPTISDAYFSFPDVRKHSSPNSVWIVIHENVYDCTSFLKDHPGGADSILINAGSDCSDDFDAIHSEKAKVMLANYHIGRLSTTALTKPVEKVLVKLVSKTQITDDVRLFRFALPAADQQFGLRPGKHVFLTATVNGKPCMRAYTPTSREDAAGYVELLIRIYADGVLTQHLDLLPLGAAVEIKGPVGRIEYAGAGRFVVDGKPRKVKQVVMVAGGTGITPIYQVIRAAMMEERGNERLDMHLVYASRSEDDILLRKELDDWTRERPERLKVWYVAGKVRRREEWGYSAGRVTEGVLTEHIPNGGEEESLALVCGPPAMIKQVVLPALEKLNYEVGKTCFIF